MKERKSDDTPIKPVVFNHQKNSETGDSHSFTLSLRPAARFHSLYFLLGANLGNRVTTLAQAVSLIGERVGRVVVKSCLYETAAWGVTNQPAFLNQVLMVETTLEPEAVLVRTQVIEHELGRVRHEHWGARTIDIDLLYYDQLVWQSPTLTLPHPLLHQRRFTLVPLTEIAPDFVHPVLRKTSRQLLSECIDTGSVSIFNSPTNIPPH